MQHASLKRLRGLLAVVTAALLAATIIFGSQPARADDYPTGYPKLGTSEESIAGLPVHLGGGKQLTPRLFTVHTDDRNGAIQAYCIEFRVGITNWGAEVDVQGWDGFPGDNKFKTDPQVRAKVAWIVQRSYPDAELTQIATAAKVEGLTKEEAIAGTQAAIWHFTDGFSYTGLTNGDTESDSAKRVQALYNYLTGEANTGLEETAGPTVTVTAPEEVGEAGKKIGPIRIESGQATVAVEPLAHPLVDADGKAVDLKAVPTGVDLFLDVPAGTAAGEQTIKVTAVGSAYSGQLLVARGKRSQTIIIGNNRSVEVSAEAKVAWKAAPTPPETTPPTPETTPPTPETTPPTPETTPPTPETTPPTPETTPPTPETTPPTLKTTPPTTTTTAPPPSRPGLPKTGV